MSGFDYTLDEDDVQDDNSGSPTLREPYIGPVELVDLKFDNDPETFGGNDVLVFTFEAQDEDHIGQQFEHLEWAPTSDGQVNDFQDEVDTNGNTNLDLLMRRLLHILSRVLDTDKETIRTKVLRFAGDTESEAWNELGMRVQQAYEKYGVTDNDLHAKAYADTSNSGGDVYVNVKFGRYPGFLRVVGQEPKLEFSSWEKNRNQEAMEAKNNTPDGSDEFEDDDEFDDDFDFDGDF